MEADKFKKEAKTPRKRLFAWMSGKAKKNGTGLSSAQIEEQDSAQTSQVGSIVTPNREENLEEDEAENKIKFDSHSPPGPDSTDGELNPVLTSANDAVEAESTLHPRELSGAENNSIPSPSASQSVISNHQHSLVPSNTNALWEEAYRNLRFKARDMVSQFEMRVLNYTSHTPAGSILDLPFNGSDENWLAGLNQVEIFDQVLRTWSGARDTSDSSPRYNKFMESITSTMMRSRKGESDTVIAWAALCLAIQTILDANDPSETFVNTIAYIAPRLEWFCALSNLANCPSLVERQKHLHSRLEELYEAILTIFLKTVCFNIGEMGPSKEDLETFYNSEKKLPLSEDCEIDHFLMRIPLQVDMDHVDQNPLRLTEEEPEAHPINSLDKLHAFDPSGMISTFMESKADISRILFEKACELPTFSGFFNEVPGLKRGLCVRGSPGTGNTMLLMGAISELSKPQIKEASESLRHASYFFCGDRSSRPTSAVTILKSLIWQVLKKQPHLSSHLDNQFEWTGRDDFNDPDDFLAMSFVFYRIVGDPEFKPTFFIVDSLDQSSACNEFLILILISMQKFEKARWLISVEELETDTRGIATSEESEELLSYISFGSDGKDSGLAPSEEIASFLVHSILKDRNFDKETCDSFVDALCKLSNGDYLWMDLACHAIAAVDPWNAKEFLESIPQEIGDFLIDRKDTILGLEWNSPVYCTHVLYVMALVYRPLHLTELADLVNIPTGVFLRGVVEKCACFLEIRENIVFFSCAAAKASIRNVFPSSPVGHAQLAQKCMEAILKMEDLTSTDFLESGHYASVYWMGHLSEHDDTKWLFSTSNLKQIRAFTRDKMVKWVDRLIADKCLSQVLSQARALEFEINRASSFVQEKAALLPIIRDICRFLAFRADSPAPSNSASFSFYPDQDVMNHYLRRDKSPTLISSVSRQDESLFHVLRGHTDWIRRCAFSSDGQLIVSASDDLTIRIWNTATGRMQHIFPAFDDLKSWNYDVACSSVDGGLLAATNGDKISIFSLTTGQLKQTLDIDLAQTDFRNLAFSADNKHLAATTNNIIVIWEVPSFNQTMTMTEDGEDAVEYVGFDNTNEILLSVCHSRIAVWDFKLGFLKQFFGVESGLLAASWSPDGEYVAVVTEIALQIRKLEDRSVVVSLEDTSVPFDSLAFSPNGLYLAASSRDGDIKILKFPWSDNPAQILKGHSRPIYKMAFSPSGQHLVSCSSDKTLRVWNIDNIVGEAANYDEGHSRAITCLELSSNDMFLASGSDDKLLCLWEGQKGTFLCSRKHEDSVALALKFSNDATRLVTGARDGVVRLWSIMDRDLSMSHRFEGHVDWVRTVMFTPSEELIVSGSDDTTIRFWNVTDRSQKFCIENEHHDYVKCIAISTDGLLLASGGDDQQIKVWEAKASSQRIESPFNLLKTIDSISAGVHAMTFTADGSQLVASWLGSGMARWDTKTWNPTSVKVSYSFYTLRTIAEEDSWLETQLGALSLESGSLRSSDPPRQSRFGISPDDWSITYGRERKLFSLPWEYWPDTEEKSTLVKGNHVVIGCHSGRLLFFTFQELEE